MSDNKFDKKSEEMTNKRVPNSIESLDDHGDDSIDVSVSGNNGSSVDFGEIEENTNGNDDVVEVKENDNDTFEPISDDDKEEDTVDADKKKKISKKKSSGGKGGKAVPLIVGGIVVVGILYFVGNMVLEVYNEMNGGVSTAIVDQNGTKKNGYEVPPEVKSEALKEEPSALAPEVGDRALTKEEIEAKKEYKKNFYSDLKDEENAPPSPIEKEIMGMARKGMITSEKGGVCFLSIEFEKGKEYVYYLFVNGEYVPAFDTESWNGKGVVVGRKIVVKGHDLKNKMSELEDGKFLPTEMFSECTVFQ